ncbi:TolC family protein [Sphingomonas sp.]|uniref:TolC family protein n=1 Tax=Sphingomonas sp. TaxID=28214 RepID=UPI003B3B0957
MYRIIAAALAAGVCASSLQAQTDPSARPGSVLTLSEALERAGAVSPAREAAAAGIQAAAAQRRIAGLRPNPSLIAESENIAGSGLYRGLRSSETTVSLALPVERGGKRTARLAVADAETQRAALDAAVAQADLRLRVTQAYNEAAATRPRAAIAREQVTIATEGLHAAQVRVKAGRASPLEAQRADVARIAAEGAAERAERNAALALQALGRLTGAPMGGIDLDWFDRIAGPGPLRPIAPAGTLAAAASQTDVRAAAAQIRLAQSQRVPDLTLTAGARRLEQTNDMAAVVGISIPLPLSNSGRASVDLASARRRQAEAQRRAILVDAAQAIASAQVEADNAAGNARTLAGPALAAAREAARIARIGYREGKFGQLDLLDAERTLADTRRAAIDALAAFHDAQARLDRLTTPAPEENNP